MAVVCRCCLSRWCLAVHVHSWRGEAQRLPLFVCQRLWHQLHIYHVSHEGQCLLAELLHLHLQPPAGYIMAPLTVAAQVAGSPAAVLARALCRATVHGVASADSCKVCRVSVSSQVFAVFGWAFCVITVLQCALGISRAALYQPHAHNCLCWFIITATRTTLQDDDDSSCIQGLETHAGQPGQHHHRF